jgi:hypothetical protein
MSRSERFQMRLTPEESLDWAAQAESERVSTSELVRRRMNGPIRVGIGISNPVCAVPVDLPRAITVGSRADCRHARRPDQYCPRCDR